MESNVLWNFKKFQNKLVLDQYLASNNYALTGEFSKSICRFCLAENPNESEHMIEAYLKCEKCMKNETLNSEKYCSKTNICCYLDKYELLTKHQNFETNNCNDSYNCAFSHDVNANNITNIFYSIKNEYFQSKEFFVWKVKSVFPNQIFLFNERYILNINDKWFEFHNGKEKHTFQVEFESPNELKLLRDDKKLFRVDLNCLYNITDNCHECEGEWVFDSNKKVHLNFIFGC